MVEVNQGVHGWGGITLHDIINDRFARKAVEKGADGIIAVATGAGGHAGRLSPFALVQEIRDWFDGPLILSGAIATGRAILAAQAMGADLGYIGSPFIATAEANATAAYKQGICEGRADDIVYSSLFTGVHGNYLRKSIELAGLDPANLPEGDIKTMDFGTGDGAKAKAWRDIWGSGQGIGAIGEVLPAGDYVARLIAEYAEAKAELACEGTNPPSREAMRRSASRLHPPQSEVDAVLAEEGLAHEDQSRHAPMAGGLERGLVRRDFGVERGGVRFGFGVELGEVEPGARRRPRRDARPKCQFSVPPQISRDTSSQNASARPRRAAAWPSRTRRKM